MAESGGSSVPQSNGEEAKQTYSECMLSQYRFCVAGVGMGTAFSLKYKRGYIPMAVGGVAGTFADFSYGHFVECAGLTNDPKPGANNAESGQN